MTKLAIGFSPCPNDTFMFHGLVSGRVAVPGIEFVPVLADIEALNERAIHGQDSRLPVTKLSVHGFAYVSKHYQLLRAGAALGRGCGPLVVARKQLGSIPSLDALKGRRVAIPGIYTTAHLLLRIFAPPSIDVMPMNFTEIMKRVAAGECDFGVIIHESRFTYEDYDLVCIADLGQLWEQTTKLPLPLGVIAASKELPEQQIKALEAGLQASIDLAWANPSVPWPYIRSHAQEMSEAVCRQHIDLYVNSYSQDLGEEGKAAIDALLAKGREVGILPSL